MERNGHKANSKYLWDMGASSSGTALVFYFSPSLTQTQPMPEAAPAPCAGSGILPLVGLLRSYQEGGLGIGWVFKTRVLEKEGFSETTS